MAIDILGRSSMQLNKNYIHAIVGASNNPEKYGYKLMQDLQTSGFKVLPINLKEQEILGEKVYASLADYPAKIDLVIFVVPPQVTRHILNQVKQLKIDKVWFQPGSESDEALKFCRENQIEAIANSCVMRAK